MDTEANIRQRYELLAPSLNERQRRLWAAAEAEALGRGGVSLVARATGLTRKRINNGRRDLHAEEPLEPGRVRRKGGGGKPAEVRDPTLWEDLERLVEPTAAGDPEHPLRWTTLSLRQLARALQALGHRIGYVTVGVVLEAHEYRLQGNRKELEGGGHPDRNAQFEYLNSQVAECLAAGEPVVSVDAKKKELVGAFKNAGREWRPGGEPEKVRVHDFVDKEQGRAVPYGVYDVAANEGWVGVGVNHDTAELAVATLRRWWQEVGQPRYPQAQRLLICADGGGSNGSRLRLWKVQVQQLAEETGLAVTVCHLPPGTSKWNKIEHRLFSYITQNWRGKPLRTYQTIVSLIAATSTQTGLTVRCELDPNAYPTGLKVSDAELAAVNLQPHEFHGDWNYTIRPRTGPNMDRL